MRLNKLLFLTTIILSAYAFELSASHIMGGTLDYIRLGPGSFPNSSRYKVKLILYRDKAGVALNDNALIYARGDANQPFDPALKPNPYSTTNLDSRFASGNAFVRDFAILKGDPIDTLTVRPEALTNKNDVTSTTSGSYFTGWRNEYALNTALAYRFPNTSITGVSTLPGYEYSDYIVGSYPAKQFMADKSSADGISGFGWVRYYDVADNSTLVDTCTRGVTNTFEVREYTRVVDLPNIPGGYHLFFEINNRNATASNIASPGYSGLTLYCRIPDVAVFDADNNSYKKLYDAYAANGLVTTLGLGGAFTFAGLNAGYGNGGGYLNDNIKNLSLTGIIKTLNNSSPRFIKRPPSFICATDAYLYSALGINPNKSGNHFSAYDLDGDRLEYELASPNQIKVDVGLGAGRDYPFTGLWRMNDATVNGTAFTATDKLFPTMPYSNLIYPYNVNVATFKPVQFTTFPGFDFVNAHYPLGLVGSVPGIFIDKNTGNTSFTPLFPITPGNDRRLVANVRVREFRNIQVSGTALVPSVSGTNIDTEAFLGEINMDYQFIVKTCPLPSLAYMIPTNGCFKPYTSPVLFDFKPNSIPDGTANWYWDSGVDRYTVTGVKDLSNPALSTESVSRIAPNGSTITNPVYGGVSSASNYKTGKNTTYTYPGVGSYFVKLVVQLANDNIGRTPCSDSVYSLVNVSEIKAGYTVSGGNIFPNSVVEFNPFATGTATGFVTTSGASLYTSLNTNPFPKVVKRRRDMVGNVVYTYLGTAFWMQPDGSRDTIAPSSDLIAPSKIITVKYGFGNGETQVFTRALASNTWVANTTAGGVNVTGPFPQLIPNTRITVTGLAGSLNNSIPGITYSYSSAISNANTYLVVKNQFGCIDSTARVIGSCLNPPVVNAANVFTVNGIENNLSVCETNGNFTISGTVSFAGNGAIWSSVSNPGAGTILEITTIPGTEAYKATYLYAPSYSEIANGYAALRLSTDVNSSSGCYVDATSSVRINIAKNPIFNITTQGKLSSNQACSNNGVYTISGTVLGAGGFALNVGNGGILAQLSTITGTVTGIGSYFAGNYTYTPSIAEANAFPFTSFGANFTASNSCGSASALRSMQLLSSPQAIITTSGIINDTIKLCSNNLLANFNAYEDGFFTNSSGLKWYTSGVGGFSNSTGNKNTTYLSSVNDLANQPIKIILEASRFGCYSTFDTLYIKYFDAPMVYAGQNTIACINNPIITLSGVVSFPASGGVWHTSGSGTFTDSGSITTTVLSAVYMPSAEDLYEARVSLTLIPTGNIIGTVQGSCRANADSVTNYFVSPPAVVFHNEQLAGSMPKLTLNASITGYITSLTSAIWGSNLNTDEASYVPNRTSFIFDSNTELLVGDLTYTPSEAEVNQGFAVMNVTVLGAKYCGISVSTDSIYFQPSVPGIGTSTGNNTTTSPIIIGNTTVIGLTTITSTIDIVNGNTITGITTFIGSNNGTVQTIVGIGTTILGTNTAIDSELANANWQVYPNPSQGTFVLIADLQGFESKDKDWKVDVFNTLGYQIATYGLGEHTLPKGLYLLKRGKVLKKLLVE